ncbi:MAG: DGQHR domain-containing protein [Candidatus Kapabacteria bacterium]|nr:DGQHR domain-containing protein [Candidatus Kapabacteria bacterium]
MNRKLQFPALRGYLGSWTYYSCLMRLQDIAERISYADEIYQSKVLSDLLQRELDKKRGKAIANYLLTEEERFFSSLVIAVYDGEPQWLPIENLSVNPALGIEIPDESITEKIGILQFNGSERLFTLDGQHRLAGIKKAVQENAELADEYLSVIFLPHEVTEEGRQRSRRLFTTLNKFAKPVSKTEIIALDEDDIIAVTLRRLVREYMLFQGQRISSKSDTVYNKSSNLAPTEKNALTTLTNLYDVVNILGAIDDLASKMKIGKGNKYSNEEYEQFYQFVVGYFDALIKAFLPLQEYLATDNYQEVVERYRNDNGGHFIFRPIGLQMIVKMTVILYNNARKRATNDTLESVIARVAQLPLDLMSSPLLHLFWQSSTKTINTKNKPLLQNILLYMAGHDGKPLPSDEKLLRDYQKVLVDDTLTLPQRLDHGSKN